MNQSDRAVDGLEPVASAEPAPLGSLRWVVFGLIHLLASALVYLPTFFLWWGVLAIGGRAGWWVGDGTANDGDEFFSVPLGLIGWGLVMGLTAALVTWLVRPRKSTRFVVAGWLLLVPIQIGDLVGVVTARTRRLVPEKVQLTTTPIPGVSLLLA